MKKLFSIFCCLLLSASMVTQAQESPIRDADVSATSSQIIADETELLDDGIIAGDVTGLRKAPAATTYDMMKNSTVQYVNVQKCAATNKYNVYIKVVNNYNTSSVKTGFVILNADFGHNTAIGGTHSFSSSYSNCTESDNWFVQNYKNASAATYVDNPYGNIKFTFSSMGSDGYPIYRIQISNCYGYTSNSGSCVNWKSQGVVFAWDKTVSVHPFASDGETRIDFTDYYTISVSSNNNSYGTVSGGGTYAAGAARTLTASVASSSYQFLGWKKNGGSSYVSTSASYNVTVNGNDSYVAEFAPKAAPQYTITTAVSPSNTYGTVTGAGSYYENNPATLTATSANEHLYIFDHWLKDGNNYAGGTTITPTVTAAATYTAVFRNAAEGTITGVANYGTISGTGHYTGGSAVTLTVTPNSGYKFAQWSDGNEDNPRTVYVDGDATYTAQFYDLNQPLLASFSWEDDDIVVQNYGDGDSYCNSFYAPYGKYFRNLFAKTNSRSSKNFFHLCIQTAQTQSWPGVTWAKIGTYPVQVPGYETNWCGSNLYWYWTLDNTDVCVAYAYDSYNLGLNELGTYLCDKTGSDDEDHDDESNYISVGDGLTCKITVGKNGNPYIRLVRNSDQQCMVSVGEAAVMHTVTITPATNGTITVKDGETIINSGDKVIEGTTLTVTTTPATGYRFDSWTNDGAASVTVNNDVTIGATFAINTYTVTVAKNNNTYGTLTDESDNVRVINNVPYGATFTVEGNQITINGTTVTATPADATARYTYSFNNWTNALATVTGDMTVTANFTRVTNTFTVTFEVKSTSAGYGLLQKDNETPTDQIIFTNVPYGTKAVGTSGNAFTFMNSTVTPIPTEAANGYTYAVGGWSGSPTSSITSNKTATISFTRTAIEYTITYNNYDISTYPGTLTTIYTVETQTITLPFAPNVAKEGYSFDGWYDNEELTGTPVTSIAQGSTGNKEFWAKWTKKAYTVNVAVDETGHGEVTADKAEVDEDGNVTVTYTADTYQNISNEAVAGFYEFVQWSDGNTENPRTISGVKANINMTAETALKTALELRDDMKDDYYEAMAEAYYNGGAKQLTSVTYRRTLASNQWAAFSLPFDLEIEGTELDSKVYAYTGATGNAKDGLNVNFAKHGSAIEAGKPYLFYSPTALTNPTFTTNGGTTLQLTDAINTADYEDGQTGSVRFTATNRRTALPGSSSPDWKKYIFLADNRLYYPNSAGTTMRPFRAYFHVDQAGAGIAPRVRIVAGGQIVTELETVTEAGGTNSEVRKYVENGVLVIERNGIRYNATGAKMN